AALASFALCAAPAASCAQAHRLVSVGDHRLDVVRAGRGGPALVFETGLGDSLDTWLPMMRTMSRSTTAIAYSRAGLGRSELGSSHNTAPEEAADLHALLHALGVLPPYILVARSYGSILARLYTSLYPTEVAGMVLVDGTHEQQVARWGQVDSTYPRAFRVYFDSVLAGLPPGAVANETRETVRIQAAGTTPGLRPLPDMPIAVITSMKSDESAPYVNGTARGHSYRDGAERARHPSRGAGSGRNGHSFRDGSRTVRRVEQALTRRGVARAMARAADERLGC